MSEGWLPEGVGTAVSLDEAKWLRAQAKGKLCLEVGAWTGFSAIVMGGVADLVVSIDMHRGDHWHILPEGQTWLSLDDYLKNLERYDMLDKVIPIIGNSKKVLPLLRGRTFDFAFIDGDHSYEGVRDDAQYCYPVLRRGGVMAFHDYGEFGVKEAIDDHWPQRKFGPDSIAYVDVI